MKAKHQVHIMVFGVVTSDGDVMLTFIFPRGFRLYRLPTQLQGVGNAGMDRVGGCCRPNVRQ